MQMTLTPLLDERVQAVDDLGQIDEWKDALVRIQQRAEVGFLGVGSITQAMVTGLGSGAAPPTVVLSPRSQSRSAALARRFENVSVATGNQDVVDRASLVVLAVRPQDALDVVGALRFGDGQPVVSVVATLPARRLEQALVPGRLAARAVPLPSAADRASLTAIWPGAPEATALFDRLGSALAVAREEILDDLSAATGAVAAHLAYIESVSAWLSARGLSREEANRYVASLFAPVARNLDPVPEDLHEVVLAHTTPGGLNELVLSTLQEHGTFETLALALDQAARRTQAR